MPEPEIDATELSRMLASAFGPPIVVPSLSSNTYTWTFTPPQTREFVIRLRVCGHWPTKRAPQLRQQRIRAGRHHRTRWGQHG